MSCTCLLSVSESIFLNTVRYISTCQVKNAGFQGLHLNMPLEMKLKYIERKKLKIRRMERKALEPIPVVDFFIPYSWKTEERKRNKEVSENELERRALLEKEWARFILQQRNAERKRLQTLMMEQEKAMFELKQESQELYEAALKPDLSILPFTCSGPVETLPLKDYLMPLGAYVHNSAPFSTDESLNVKLDVEL
ncbi:large ribosomal subunit protein mL40 [Ciona intestinalis]